MAVFSASQLICSAKPQKVRSVIGSECLDVCPAVSNPKQDDAFIMHSRSDTMISRSRVVDVSNRPHVCCPAALVRFPIYTDEAITERSIEVEREITVVRVDTSSNARDKPVLFHPNTWYSHRFVTNPHVRLIIASINCRAARSKEPASDVESKCRRVGNR